MHFWTDPFTIVLLLIALVVCGGAYVVVRDALPKRYIALGYVLGIAGPLATYTVITALS